jgi:hypothetical protein
VLAFVQFRELLLRAIGILQIVGGLDGYDISVCLAVKDTELGFVVLLESGMDLVKSFVVDRDTEASDVLVMI